MSKRGRAFSLKFDMSLILEISDKICSYYQLWLSYLITTLNLWFSNKKIAYIMKISYHLDIVYLWYKMHL